MRVKLYNSMYIKVNRKSSNEVLTHVYNLNRGGACIHSFTCEHSFACTLTYIFDPLFSLTHAHLLIYRIIVTTTIMLKPAIDITIARLSFFFFFHGKIFYTQCQDTLFDSLPPSFQWEDLPFWAHYSAFHIYTCRPDKWTSVCLLILIYLNLLIIQLILHNILSCN